MVLVENHYPSSSHIINQNKKTKQKCLNNISKTHMSRKIKKTQSDVLNFFLIMFDMHKSINFDLGQ